MLGQTRSHTPQPRQKCFRMLTWVMTGVALKVIFGSGVSVSEKDFLRRSTLGLMAPKVQAAMQEPHRVQRLVS